MLAVISVLSTSCLVSFYCTAIPTTIKICQDSTNVGWKFETFRKTSGFAHFNGVKEIGEREKF